MNPVDNPVETQPGRNGGTLRKGGTNPGAGRPPDAFKERMRVLANLEDADLYLRKCLKGENGPKAFIAAQQYVTEHGYGKARQSLEVTGEDGAPLVTRITFVKPDARDR